MKSPNQIYLDFAAATPVAPEVLQLMEPYFSDQFYNPSAAYLAARHIKKDIAQARSQVAHWLGCKPAEIVFTAGVTESINLALRGVLAEHPDGKILVGATEHSAVLETVRHCNHQVIPVKADGRIDLNALKALLTDEVVLVSLMYANNETGVIHPLREVASVLEEVRRQRRAGGNQRPLYLHSDAAQASNYLALHAARLGVDLLSLNGAKMYGPKQSGVLYVKAGTTLQPLIFGGGQERGLRGGTENVASIIGFAAALDSAQQQHQEESVRLQVLRDELESRLLTGIKDAQVNGSRRHRLPNILNVSIPGLDGERFVQELDEEGVMIATGAACSADDDGPSHVLLAMGVSDDLARGSLRFSLGRQTTTDDIIQTVKTVLERLA